MERSNEAKCGQDESGDSTYVGNLGPMALPLFMDVAVRDRVGNVHEGKMGPQLYSTWPSAFPLCLMNRPVSSPFLHHFTFAPQPMHH